jgi:hypothetical protein
MQAVGLWSRLESRKAIFVEPKRKVEFMQVGSQGSLSLSVSQTSSHA